MEHGYEFRILGPVEIVNGGEAIPIRGPRQQTVMAVLTLEANHVVPVNTLIDALWDDNPPSTARSQVQIIVSSLRKTINTLSDHELILTRPPGYELRVAAETVDALRFDGLIARGRAAARDGRLDDALRYLQSALDLWRGPASAGIDSRVVQNSVARLNEQRLAVLEERVALELQLGRHAQIIGELTSLAADHPLRERLQAQRMLALYRAGRQADALESYRLTRQTLNDELGLEPGAELRQLEQAILVNDPALELTAGRFLGEDTQRKALVPRQLPAAPADFTGRTDLVRRVSATLMPTGEDGGAARPPQVVLLTGMSGVGKTILALHVAHLVKDQFPDGQLFIELSESDARPVSPRQALVRSLRALGVETSALPGDLVELADLYRSLLATRRILVVLDDAASVSQVLPLLPGSASCAVIITSRYRLPTLARAQSVEVKPLQLPTAVELISKIIGNDGGEGKPGDIQALAELCGCLPLALRIVGAKLLDHPHWTVGQLVRRLMDERSRLAELQIDTIGVRASISLSFEGLDGDEKRLLLMLGLVGNIDFPYWVGAPLLDTEVSKAERLLDELVKARLVDVQVAANGLPRFQLHELIRAFAMERLAAEESGPARGAALARLLGCWLYLACEAHRREYGGEFTVIHGAGPLWPVPGWVLDSLLSNPLDWLRAERRSLMTAIGKAAQAAQAGVDEICWDLAVTSVTLFEADSLFDEWRTSHEIALGAVRGTQNVRGEAMLLCSLGELALVEQRLEDAAHNLRAAIAAFEAVGSSHGRGLATGHLAFVDRLQGHGEQALARYRNAITDLRAAGDKVAESHALSGMANVYLDRKEYDKVESLLNDALSICAGLGVRRMMAQVTYRMAELRLEQGQPQLAEQAFEATLHEVRAGGDRLGQAHALRGLGISRTQQGRLEAAETALRAALEISHVLKNRLVEGQVLLALGEMLAVGDHTEEALALLDQAVETFGEVGAVVWRARVLMVSGRLHEAAGRGPSARKAWIEALESLRAADAVQVGPIVAELASWVEAFDVENSLAIPRSRLFGKGPLPPGRAIRADCHGLQCRAGCVLEPVPGGQAGANCADDSGYQDSLCQCAVHYRLPSHLSWRRSFPGARVHRPLRSCDREPVFAGYHLVIEHGTAVAAAQPIACR